MRLRTAWAFDGQLRVGVRFADGSRRDSLMSEIQRRTTAHADRSWVPEAYSASRDPSRFNSARRATISRMSDAWPPAGPQKQEPLLEHVRDLWVLHGIESNCIAGLYQTTFGIGLRIHQNNELIESRLSKVR
jgi:hypothetical protein